MCIFFGRVLSAVSLLFCLTVAAAAIEGAPPPHLGLARAKYYHQHPREWAALLDRLPKPRHVTAPVLRAPAAPPSPAVIGGTWTDVAALFPGAGASAPQLLMDGSVLVHDYCTRNWHKLRPDAFGNYANGSWTAIAPMPAGYAPLYFASQTLSDGRLIVNGGEYNDAGCAEAWTNLGAIYNPVTNVWTPVPAPAGWTTIGDAPSVVLRDRTYLLANCCTKEIAKLNATTLTWTPVGTGKFDTNVEENWSLLPNGKVITANSYYSEPTCGRNLEIFDSVTNVWSFAALSPVQLSDCGAGQTYEIGPHVVRPNGDVVFFSGVTGGVASGTAVYKTYTGAIAAGPNVPAVGGVNITLADAPAALLPSGKILFAASDFYVAPTTYFEYTLTNRINKITNQPTGAADTLSYYVNMLVLPSGQVLQTDFSNTLQLYNPVGAPAESWRPALTTPLSTLTRGASVQVAGTQLNGRSEGGFYGDDAQASTNFPLFRIRNNATGHVFYCRTTYQSNRGIRAGQEVTAWFKVPTNVEIGASTFEVVANGIPSLPIAVTVN